MTPTEAILWEALRSRRFHNLKFRRQHPVDNFVLDFFCAEHSLAVEVDGAVHDDPGQQQKDQSRENILQSKGIRVLRIPAALVEHDTPTALARIAYAIHAPSPQRSPAERKRE